MTKGKFYGRFYKTEINPHNHTTILERALRLTLEKTPLISMERTIFRPTKVRRKGKAIENKLFNDIHLREHQKFPQKPPKMKLPKGLSTKNKQKKKKQTTKKHIQKFTLDHRKLALRQIQEENAKTSPVPLVTQSPC